MSDNERANLSVGGCQRERVKVQCCRRNELLLLMQAIDSSAKVLQEIKNLLTINNGIQPDVIHYCAIKLARKNATWKSSDVHHSDNDCSLSAENIHKFIHYLEM